ncbi:class I SAM-dependent methyltransferase [Pseudotamlana agarivorans]|uniref:class I SAM-dependent methyltransferase n=1 Tax=Pseudotamlana agarivorans TaxID=481183 RepID=UPI00082A4D81|nr:class I SAM-dependent methyltransferase [Tamlana agarivorans]
MSNFWEQSFQKNNKMWGEEPSVSAAMVANDFMQKGYKEILIPGCGYGRNAKPFIDLNMEVTGIEISQTAINIAAKTVPHNFKIYNGDVTDMSFDEKKYDGIYCYSLLHLLELEERISLINKCYAQLVKGGTMVFVTLSTNDYQFGKGSKISKNRFLSKHNVKLYFHNAITIDEEFRAYGLIGAKEILEPKKNPVNKHFETLWMITCRK